MAALQALRQRVMIDWPKMIEADAKALLLRTAREGHARIMRDAVARSGVFPFWDAYANTPGNTNLETVRLPGPIVYRYRYLREVILVTLKMLEEASPIHSGKYKTSHTVWVNGVAASPNVEIKRGDEVFIANTVPYARRLEVGKTDSGRDFLVSVPNKIYERTSKKLKQRYRNVSDITFGYVTLPGAWRIKGRLGPQYKLPTGAFRKRRQKVGELVRAPAIFIGALS